ncbi:MAG TPA: hypothetical protein VEQ42_03245, partial [Pyrinomonadaceae bacterium]|nr:hypothetical protein [Pyrinomonadaceae bacterium]
MRVRQLFIPSRPTFRPKSCLLVSLVLLLAASAPVELSNPSRTRAFAPPNAAAPATNIKELVPEKYRKRYARWKAEYLSTAAGRRQWERYASDRDFTLTINLSPELGQGGVVGDYRWDA